MSVSIIKDGAFVAAGSELPPNFELPPWAAKYAVTVSGDDGVTAVEPAPSAPAPKRKVRARKRLRR